MAIEVEGPDGAVIEFPDGTPPDVMKGAMQKHYASFSPPDRAPPPESRMQQFAASAQNAARANPPTWADTGVDVAKSAGIGLAQGGLGLATLPGNLEMLGRMGIDKGSELLGLGNPNTAAGQKLPHYGDAKKFVEGYTGKFYEPKTTAGKYARTVGEFAPMALNPTVGLATRAASTIGGGLVSEWAGQATEGTAAEPWARFAGGVVGGSVLPRASIRTLSPNPVPADRARHLAVLEREGVTDLTAGQATGKRPLKWAESVTQDTPFGGTRAADIQTRQAEQFTRAALRRAGIQADRATPDVMNTGFDRLSQQFETLAQNVTIPPNRRLARDLQRAATEYNDVVAPTMRVPMVNGIVTDLNNLMRSGGPLGGRAYGTLSSQLGRRARDSQFSDPTLSRTLYSIKEALDNAAERALPTQFAGQYRQARTEYRNLLTLEKAAGGAGENAVTGLISPAQLRTATKTSDKRGYTRGRDDLSELARAGVAIMSPLPQSGTAPRAAVQGVLQSIGGIGGYGAAGIEGAALGLAATIGGPALAARGVMSRPFQGYMGNQVLAPAYNALQNPALRSYSTVSGPIAFEERPMEVTITGGDVRRNRLMPQ